MTLRFRIEKDTMGDVRVPAEKYWGAQTERSRNNFKIGPSASMPLEVIYGFAYLKKAAAHTNHQLDVLSAEKIKQLQVLFKYFKGESLSELKETIGDKFSWEELKLYKASLKEIL